MTQPHRIQQGRVGEKHNHATTGRSGHLWKTLSITAVALLVAATIAAPVTATKPETPTGDELVAEYWGIFEDPIRDRLEPLLATFYPFLDDDSKEDFDRLLDLLEEAEEDLLETLRSQGSPRWLTDAIGVEGCTGDGACGGSYKGDSNTTAYVHYKDNEYNTCNDMETFVTTIVGDNNEVCVVHNDNEIDIETGGSGAFTFAVSGESGLGTLVPIERAVIAVRTDNPQVAVTDLGTL